MTRTPPAHLLDDQARRLTAVRWRDLRAELDAHLAREKRAGQAIPDGYPAGTLGGGGGGGWSVDGEHIAATSVEQAVALRLERAVMPDAHERHTWGAERAWQAILDHLDALEAHLRAMAMAEVVIDPEGWCENHARIGMAEPSSDRYRNLCRPCGDYRAANGILPGRSAMEHRHTHGAWPPVHDARRGARVGA